MGVENSYLKLSVKYQYGDDVKHRRIQAGKIWNSFGVANDFFSRVNSWWENDFLVALLFSMPIYVILVLNAFWNHGNYT